MDTLSNEYKEDVEDSEERKTLFKALIKMHLQKSIIWYELTSIMSIDEKFNKAQKDDVNINKPIKW